MKALTLAIAAAAALAISAGSAAAQSPGCSSGCDGHAGCMSALGGHGHMLGGHGHASGWHPFFSKIGGGGHGMFCCGMFGGKALFCNHGHLFGDGHGGAFGGGQINVVDPRSGNAGQLVFPQNPFVRGPRDYFMWDER
jgi:hypothetical protein